MNQKSSALSLSLSQHRLMIRMNGTLNTAISVQLLSVNMYECIVINYNASPYANM